MIKIEAEQDFLRLESAVRCFYRTSSVMPCQALLSTEYMTFKKKILQQLCLDSSVDQTIKAFLPALIITYCRKQCWLHACEPLNTMLPDLSAKKDNCLLPLKRNLVHE